MGARLLAVADAFDTITTDRPYRTAPGINHAINELRRSAGTQFCPNAVEAFISAFKVSGNSSSSIYRDSTTSAEATD